MPAPAGDPDQPLQLQICSLDYNSYVGRIGIGRIKQGRMRAGQEVAVMYGDENKGKSKIAQIMMNPKQYVASLVKLADINGDGKVDYNDISELIKKIQEQNQNQANK